VDRVRDREWLTAGELAIHELGWREAHALCASGDGERNERTRRENGIAKTLEHDPSLARHVAARYHQERR
jgi:hypothetical protein